jgi:hypothetical protein
MPIVLPAPAPGGHTTRFTPSLRATCQAWTGPRAAGRQQRIFGRNAATFGNRHACGTRHVLVHHIMHAERGTALVDLKRRRERGESLVGRRLVDLHRAAQKEVGVEIAQGQIGIGDRGVDAAAP